MDWQQDAIERQKQGLTLADEAVAMARKQIENQERIISLLEEIKNK